MKNILRFTALLAAFTLAFSACDKNNNNDPGGSEINNEPRERLIVYTVEQTEIRKTLETEGEWDVLLDMFCDQAMSGHEVTFYNMNPTTYLTKKDTKGTKAAKTFSTTNRDEMKAWMKKMEEEGRTVVVTYDNGTWSGMAYSCAPSANTSNSIIGTWHFNCLSVNHLNSDGSLQGSDLYVPEDGGGSMYYTFYDNGNMTLTINGVGGTTATDNSSWTLTDDGKLDCELLPNSGNWDVNWITHNTMIISRRGLDDEGGDNLYQLQFDRE